MSARGLAIGIDVGTSSIKALAADDAGRTLAVARRPVRTETPDATTAVQDPEAMLAGAVAALHEVVATAGPADHAAIAVSGQMGGVLVADAALRPRTPWLCTLDTRSHAVAERHETEAGGRIRAINRASPFMAARLRWLVEEARLPTPVAGDRAALIGSWIGARLCGDAAALAIDRTSLTWTGMADVRRAAWDEELAAAAHWSTERLPPVVEPTTSLGVLDRAVAAAAGLPAGTRVIAGAGDQAAALWAAGVAEPGDAADIAATFPILVATGDEAQLDAGELTGDGIEAMASVQPGIWHALTFMLGTGRLPRWWAERFWPGAEADFARLDPIAEGIAPGADGLLVVPHLSGRGTPPAPAARGAILGLTWSHGPAHVYRGMLEGLAAEYARLLDLLTSRGLRMTEPIVAFGGGVESELLTRIKADVMGVSMRVLEPVDLSALGAAKIAAAAEDWPVPRGPAVRAEVAPDPANRARYAELRERYARLEAPGSLLSRV